jgi:uncharacterized membrane protein YqjE
LAAEPSGSPKEITAAVQEVAERAQVLVREEIELAKTEITEKVTKLVKGAAVGAAAGVFAVFGLSILIQGFAWLAWWALPVKATQIFWGFFLVAALLFVLGGLAGFFAARLFKKGSPPTPELAIEEAQRIRETVTGD